MFIIVAIIYSSYGVLANESDNCDCDVLQVNDPDGPIGFENTMCKDEESFYIGRSIKSQCLVDNSGCFATRELTRIFGKGIHSKQVKLQATNPCRFPFIFKNVTYKTCTKMDQESFGALQQLMPQIEKQVGVTATTYVLRKRTS